MHPRAELNFRCHETKKTSKGQPEQCLIIRFQMSISASYLGVRTIFCKDPRP
jgi:hypothetical protein